MKRSTAVRHLREMADEAPERLRFGGLPLAELWVSGTFLELGTAVHDGVVLLHPRSRAPVAVAAPEGRSRR